MKTIEFVGPSGIGKTTFLKCLMKQRVKSEWITREEGKRWLSRNEGKFLRKALSRIIGYVGLSLKGDNKRKINLINELKDNEKECKDIIQIFYKYLQVSDMESWQKVRMHDYYMNGILYQILSLYSLPPDSTLILDEGIIQNGGLENILDDIEKYKSLKDSFILPDGVIYCTLSNGHYSERLNARFKERGDRFINSILVDVADDEIEDVMMKARQNSIKKMQACRALGISVLEIEPIKSQEQIDKALRFINSFREDNRVWR